VALSKLAQIEAAPVLTDTMGDTGFNDLMTMCVTVTELGEEMNTYESMVNSEQIGGKGIHSLQL
jgi:hypothetical protein